jgi:FKBP-type peptidyl-prolyl cis-trans isomerase SlyD
MDRPHQWLTGGVLAGVCLLMAGPADAEETGQKAEAAPATIQDNMAVEMDYTLTVDGEVVDSSDGRGPFRYVHGKGQIVPGLERQLAGLSVGDSRQITVTPEEGYGAVDAEAFMEIPRTQMPPDAEPTIGQMLRGTDSNGQSFRATIHEIHDDTVTLDLNHPLAGKTLQFTVKVLTISPS